MNDVKVLIVVEGLCFLGLLAFGAFLIKEGASAWWFVGAALAWVLCTTSFKAKGTQ